MDDAAPVPAAQTLEALTRLVRDARSMPVSASCVVHRGEVLGLLEQIARGLPAELGRAAALLEDREGVLAAGRAEAELLLEQAREQQRVLVGKDAVRVAAEAEARQLLASTRQECEEMRLEVEDYVDAKLANFEVVLSKTLGAVQRGRARLHGESDLDSLDADHDDRPLPG